MEEKQIVVLEAYTATDIEKKINSFNNKGYKLKDDLKVIVTKVNDEEITARYIQVMTKYPF